MTQRKRKKNPYRGPHVKEYKKVYKQLIGHLKKANVQCKYLGKWTGSDEWYQNYLAEQEHELRKMIKQFESYQPSGIR